MQQPPHQNQPVNPILPFTPVRSFRDLASLANQLVRTGYYYHRRTVELDGLTFVECSFENCTFITRSGTFSLRQCRIYGPETVFMYDGPALKIVRLHELMNTAVVGRQVFPNLYPQADKDGRITIQ